jgi:Fuc2NAc and GlcNAc transferase
MLGYVVPALAALAASYVATKLLIPLLRRRIVDVPTGRSSHRSPTPRGGGLGILAGFVCGILAARLTGAEPAHSALIAATLLTAMVGVLDDALGGIPASVRLLAQVLVASWLMLQTGPFESLPLPLPMNAGLGAAAPAVTILWLVGVTNIYNFLDGIDGFAALQGIVAGVALALMGLGYGLSVACLALAAACAGFLVHNWHPARVFMGDVGSTAIGFFLAGAPLSCPAGERALTVFFVALCLWFFLSDGTYTLIARLLRKEKIWEAHRSHLYQQLVRAGLRHDTVSGRVGLLASAVAAFAVLAARIREPWAEWLAAAAAAAGFLAYLRWVTQSRLHSHDRLHPTQA